MGAFARTIQVAANTGTAQQDILIPSGVGSNVTPVAVMLEVTSATATSTDTAHARRSIGFSDGSSHACVAIWSQDAQLVSNAERVGFYNTSSNKVLIDIVGGTGRATFDSFQTGGVRIQWGTLPSAAFLITATFFFGVSIQAKVGLSTLGGSDGNTASPSIPFRTDLLFTMAYGSTSSQFDGSVLADAHMSVGIAGRGSGQFSKNWMDQDNQSTAQLCSAYVSSNRVAQYITNETTLGAAIEVTAFGDSSVTFTERGAQTNGMAIAWLAIKLDDAMRFSVQRDDTPTATGSKSYTFGFKPQWVLGLGTQLSAVDSHNNGALSGSMSLCYIDATNQFGVSIRSDDGSAASDTSSQIRATAEFGMTDAGGVGIEASFTSFDTTGMTLNYSSVGGNARVWCRVAIEEARLAANGSVVGVGSTAGAPKGTGALNGKPSGIGYVSGDPKGTAAASGLVAALGSVSGAPKGTAAASGRVLSVGSTAASPKGTAAASGSQVALASSSGAASGKASASGHAVAIAVDGGSITGRSDMAGTSLALAIVTGFSTPGQALAFGQAVSLALTSGALSGAGRITSQAIALALDAGNPKGTAPMEGRSVALGRVIFNPGGYIAGPISGTAIFAGVAFGRMADGLLRARGTAMGLVVVRKALILHRVDEAFCTWDRMADDALMRNLRLQGDSHTLLPEGLAEDAVGFDGLFREDYREIGLDGVEMVVKAPNLAIRTWSLPELPVPGVDKVVTADGRLWRVTEVRVRGVGLDLILRTSSDQGDDPGGDGGSGGIDD